MFYFSLLAQFIQQQIIKNKKNGRRVVYVDVDVVVIIVVDGCSSIAHVCVYSFGFSLECVNEFECEIVYQFDRCIYIH